MFYTVGYAIAYAGYTLGVLTLDLGGTSKNFYGSSRGDFFVTFLGVAALDLKT